MKSFYGDIREELNNMQAQGFFKKEAILSSAQEASIRVSGKSLVNFCSNNYLGLSNHPLILQEAKKALDTFGFGMSSVRFICGTNALHKDLEEKTADYLGLEDVIVFPSCFDANGGIFEVLLQKEDAVFSDALNHASIIDGIRLSKAQRFRYKHADISDLESHLASAKSCRRKLIVTDGVFSMDGEIAPLEKLVVSAKKSGALIMIDDCHATGILGKNGKGTHELKNVMKDIDIITGTYGKALGGASGGFVAGKKEVIELLRQKARPYLFSNAVAPAIAAASIKALELAQKESHLRSKLFESAEFVRKSLEKEGFSIISGDHPIIPVLFPNANFARQFAQTLFKKEILAVAFSYPVVPKESPRIRLQISASHEQIHLEELVKAFAETAKELQLFSKM